MFSTTVKLADLDDFLQPAQECIKPLLTKSNKSEVKVDIAADTIQVRPDLIKIRKPKTKDKQLSLSKNEPEEAQQPTEAGQISLYDCLACSGCVTSAEVVLIQQQGVDEFLKNVQLKKVTVVSISPQSRAALCLSFGMNPKQLMNKLTTALKLLGVTYVVDMSVSEAIALTETRKEFTRRLSDYDKDPKGGHLPLIVSHCPGWVCYAEKILEPELLCHMSRVMSSQAIQGKLVEKILKEHHNAKALIWRCRLTTSPCVYINGRYISARYILNNKLVDSPNKNGHQLHVAENKHTHDGLSQKGDGDGDSSYIKSWKDTDILRKRLNSLLSVVTSSDIHHTCIMPCYDKKLESMREEFHMPRADGADSNAGVMGIPYVDSVLTTSEVITMLEKCDMDLTEVPEALSHDNLLLDILLPNESNRELLSNASIINDSLITSHSYNASSGAYVEDMCRYISQRDLHGSISDVFPIHFNAGRNVDYKDAFLRNEVDSSKDLHFVMAYGFRNIQNIVSKIKKQKVALLEGGAWQEQWPHFVEIMACPGGCLNGGGQVIQRAALELKQTSSKIQNDTMDNNESPNNPDSVAERMAKIAESREMETVAKRQSRLDKLDYLISRAPDIKIVNPQNHGLVGLVYQLISGCPDWLTADTKDMFVSTFRSFKQMEIQDGIIPPSSLKW